MSRREEVEVILRAVSDEVATSRPSITIATCSVRKALGVAVTLADEVDDLRAVITKLLAMLDPGEEHPKWGHGICESCGWHGCFSSFVGRAGGELQDDDESLCPVCEDTVQDVDRSIYVNLYARACEIAGRVK